ncbi:MAG: GNAT family N-acetyltransferase [Rickettsiales bacterium]
MPLTKKDRRFELVIDEHVVFADYRMDGTKLYVDHVEAAPELRGKGAAGQLMEELVSYAKAENLNLVPICSYAVAWLARHKH